jgi:SAM-dependent methyltransferase
MRPKGFVKFTFLAPGRVAGWAKILGSSKRLSRPDFPLQLFNLTTPSPAMLARARRRCPTLSAGGRLYRMDVTALEFPAASFDAAVATFLFCVLPESQQVPALRELDRVVRPGGLIRLLEYVRPRGTLRRIVSRLWDPWIAWAYGASFDRQIERHVLAAGLEIVESRYVVDDLVKLLTLRAH